MLAEECLNKTKPASNFCKTRLKILRNPPRAKKITVRGSISHRFLIREFLWTMLLFCLAKRRNPAIGRRRLVLRSNQMSFSLQR